MNERVIGYPPSHTEDENSTHPDEVRRFAGLLTDQLDSLFEQYVPKDPRIKTQEELDAMELAEKLRWTFRRGEARLDPLSGSLNFEIVLHEGENPTNVTIRSAEKTRRRRHDIGGYEMVLGDSDYVVRVKKDQVWHQSIMHVDDNHDLYIGEYLMRPEWVKVPTVEEMDEYSSILRRVPTEAENIRGLRIPV